MAKASTDLLGTGQVVTTEEEHVFRISAKKLRNYAILAGVAFVLVSSLIVYAVLKHRGADSMSISPDKGAVSQSTSQSANTVTNSGTATTTGSSGGSMAVIPGPFTEKQIMVMAFLGYKQIMRERVFDDDILKRTNFEEGMSSIKCLGKEKGTDENGIKRDIYTVDVHLVGTYKSVITNMTRPFETSFKAYVIKVDYGPGFKILNKEVIKSEA